MHRDKEALEINLVLSPNKYKKYHPVSFIFAKTQV